MTPLLCVGETLEEREAGLTLDRVTTQLATGLDGVGGAAVAGLIVAYEPVWAIGTGLTATPEDAQEACLAIRREVTNRWNLETGDSLRIQYGGSVKPVNAPDLMRERDIDGLLVGGASLDPDEFARIIAYRLIS
jgi:triosephosphate isomerase